MLAAGLRSAAKERGLSLREIGRRLHYRQPVVLSHMASGRVAVPTDRAVDIAKEVGLPAGPFLQAVLRQQHPTVEWALITETTDLLMADLENAAKKPLHQLSIVHRRVLKEVVADDKPQERWIAESEVFALKYLRQVFPNLSKNGLSEADRETLDLALELTRSDATPQPTCSQKNEEP